jgi:hypothetical protein
MKWRGGLFVGVVAALMVLALLLPRIPQSEAYHNFADTRALLGIPNCLNVISNALFFVVGILGIKFAWHASADGKRRFIDARERWPWLFFFAAVTLTAFGSAYYHLNPNDNTLVWDRLPMAVGFMALLAAVLAERVNVTVGLWLLAPSTLLGAASVLWWSVTQTRGEGDLRPYALVQFGSLPILLLFLALYPARYTNGADLIVSLAIYGIAKIFETVDGAIFALGHMISGHTLKHAAAALSAYWILRMLKTRHPVATRASQPQTAASLP